MVLVGCKLDAIDPSTRQVEILQLVIFLKIYEMCAVFIAFA